ncbi:MAG: putative adenylate class-3/4/guanylyl cyclase [Xanthobacteraceae bacterium]|nr:putative adenylate class-3/4/guanylyl cyclase [Xanthobacteraceae bacterium]
MNVRDIKTSIAASRLGFDRYILDLDCGRLLVDDKEIVLRPKTFAVLRHLVENPRRLISKDALFAAVWPNLTVTDDALVQSIGELRRALGEDGARLIKTIPRRGYRLEADVRTLDPAGPSSAGPVPIPDRQPQPAASARGKLIAPIILAVMVLAVLLWSSLGSDWTFPSWPGLNDRPAIRSSEIAAKPSIAVLPLVILGDNSVKEYFADGLTQDVINALGRFSALTVMSWNAVFPYKNKPAHPEDIRRVLGVRYFVEGSVRQIGDRIRVIAQLVDASDGRVLWSARFDEALADVFVLQDNMTTQIVGVLAVRVAQTEQRRVSAKPTESLEAYDYVLRARPALQRPTRANNVEARALLRRAIQLDPGYAAAYAALAETFHIDVAMGWAQSPGDSLGRAEQMANEALRHDASEVRARIILGRIHLFYQRHEQAQAEIDRAIAINPNDPHGLAGRGNILLWLGQTDAAIQSLELARRIDPELNAIDRNSLSLAYYLKRRYDAAIEEAEINVRQTESAHFSRAVLAAAYAQRNQTEDAARIVTTIRQLDPTFNPQDFGTKFLNPVDLERLRDGLRKAGL